MESTNNSEPSQAKDGCGTMLVWYLRMCCYVGVVGGFIALATPANSGMGIIALVICGGFLLLTRRKT